MLTIAPRLILHPQLDRFVTNVLHSSMLASYGSGLDRLTHLPHLAAAMENISKWEADMEENRRWETSDEWK